MIRESWDRYFDWVVRREKALVNRQPHGLVVSAVVRLTAWGAAVWIAPPARTTWELIGVMVMGLLSGSAALNAWMRASSFRNGWVHGRSQMVSSLAESGRRGHSMEDWLQGEMERDITIFGPITNDPYWLNDDEPD